MLASVFIIVLSVFLFAYWFRYSCLLLLRNAAEPSEAAESGMSAKFGFREVQRDLERMRYAREAISVAAGVGVAVTFLEGLRPASAPTLPGWPSTTVAYASDLALHGSWGTCYQLGPGTIHVAHTKDEMITKDDLREGVRLYVKLARELLA